ncbi:hypothetical protein [Amycolatopsis australiensis]|uniref:Septum formation-related domain-containing protein n=1 Tax=Amycolatopsis australiensis TaxID=546364 RepID=A0A1K1T7J3_9PSEU|nr:hypothetical protein [Amycolatopsis australiensis]SFW92587.1 hypothetical protein SAMN04489730_8729 [Amycolatopsis australiensis]
MYPRLKALAVAMLCALLAACANTQAAPEPSSGPTPLTSSAALGDFATVDYCSLLDVPAVAPGAVASPTFETCQARLGARTILVGPLAFDSDPNIRPYAYPGPVPDGVAVQQSMFNDRTACTRAITFADGNRLDLSVSDTSDDQAARCGVADAAVGSVLGVVTANKVGRLKFPERSWGLVAPCALLDTHDLDDAAGADSRPATGLSGHSCIRGKVSFKLTVETDEDARPAETVGGREARLRTAGAFCLIDTTQPAPGLPGRRELAEISVVETAGTANDATCAHARAAAASIFPRLPHA